MAGTLKPLSDKPDSGDLAYPRKRCWGVVGPVAVYVVDTGAISTDPRFDSVVDKMGERARYEMDPFTTGGNPGRHDWVPLDPKPEVWMDDEDSGGMFGPDLVHECDEFVQMLRGRRYWVGDGTGAHEHASKRERGVRLHPGTLADELESLAKELTDALAAWKRSGKVRPMTPPRAPEK